MRVMFSSGAGYSHIAPMLPLALAARDAGHEVVFVTGEEAVRFAEDAGVRGVAVGPARDAAGDDARWGRARAEMATMSADERLSHLMAQYMVGVGAAARLDDMVTFVREWRPGLVVSNPAERAAVMAAAIVDVPYVMHAIGPPKTASVMAAAWDVADGLVRTRGLDGLPSRDSVPYLEIWPFEPRGAQVWEYPTRWPLRPDGVLPAPGVRPELLADLPYDRTAYLTLGTTHNMRPGVLETMVAALRDERVNLVVTAGRDAERFGAQPAHVRIADFVPQQRILPFVDVVMCHAGAATVLGATAHGVPLVVAPLATDQFDAAASVVAGNVGVQASSGPPSESEVRAAVLAALADDTLRASAAAMAADIGALPAPDVVLEDLAVFAESRNGRRS